MPRGASTGGVRGRASEEEGPGGASWRRGGPWERLDAEGAEGKQPRDGERRRPKGGGAAAHWVTFYDFVWVLLLALVGAILLGFGWFKIPAAPFSISQLLLN